MEILLVLLAIGYGLLPIILLFWVAALGRRISRLESAQTAQVGQMTQRALVTDGPGRADPATAPDDPVAPEAVGAPEPAKAAPAQADPWSGTSGPVPPEGPGPSPTEAPTDALAAMTGAQAPVAADPGQNQPAVFRQDRFDQLAAWLKANWVYVVSAVSLAAAGVFLVQYGMENGLLPPAARVVFSLLLGAALVVAGEWLRRKHGDGAELATAYLPQVFAGAGVVVLFGAVIAARQLYGLIGPELAFAALLLVAVLAVVLGWFHGQLLAAVGLLGAALSPFVVGGDTDSTDWLYGYFTLIGAAGLAIDAARRWAWTSVLALVLAFGCNWLTLVGYGGAGWHALSATLLVALTMAVPIWRLWPDHDGPMLTEAAVSGGTGGWPAFPVRLVAGAVAAATVLLVLTDPATATEVWIQYICLTALALALILWAHRATALADLAVVPIIGFLFVLAMQGSSGIGPVASTYFLPLAEGAAAPWSASWLLALAVTISLAAAWRSFGAAPWPRVWGLAAALVAPVAAVILELFWHPAAVIGAYPWALHVMAVAAGMVALAVRYARTDGEDHARMAYATLSALSLIALSLFILTTGSALTLALAVLVVAALALDRRFVLPQMTIFVQIAVAVLGWRLVVDPGIDWAVDAPLGPVLLTFGAVLLALAAGLWLIRGLQRDGARAFLESAFAGFAAILGNVLIERWLPQSTGWFGDFVYWRISLHAMPWLVMALVQLYRLKIGGWLFWVRTGVAAVAGFVAAVGLLVATLPLNPLFSGEQLLGMQPFDSLTLAYGLPALLLLGAVRVMPHLPMPLRVALVAAGSALAILWFGLEIRRFWLGPAITLPRVSQPELYSYTVALLVAGGLLLYQSIARNSVLLRRLAMAVIAVTVAKVFLIDASGLSGLTRVFSFLALGLSLAGLAWLNRWAAAQGASEDPPAPQ